MASIFVRSINHIKDITKQRKDDHNEADILVESDKGRAYTRVGNDFKQITVPITSPGSEDDTNKIDPVVTEDSTTVEATHGENKDKTVIDDKGITRNTKVEPFEQKTEINQSGYEESITYNGSAINHKKYTPKLMQEQYIGTYDLQVFSAPSVAVFLMTISKARYAMRILAGASYLSFEMNDGKTNVNSDETTRSAVEKWLNIQLPKFNLVEHHATGEASAQPDLTVDVYETADRYDFVLNGQIKKSETAHLITYEALGLAGVTFKGAKSFKTSVTTLDTVDPMTYKVKPIGLTFTDTGIDLGTVITEDVPLTLTTVTWTLYK